MVSVNRSFKRPLDWSRSRAGFQGYPECYVSFGTVGHNDNTPAYLRVENGLWLLASAWWWHSRMRPTVTE